MREFSTKRPILFEIGLLIVSFMVVVLFTNALQALGADNNSISVSVSRIFTGAILIAVFWYCFKLKDQFSGFLIALPAILFAGWNILNCYMTDGGYYPLSMKIFIFGFAPAIFEETLFRGIFIHNLKASGKSDRAAILISAAFFAIAHLTNGITGDILQASIQAFYFFVIGLVLSAVFIKTGDLVTVIIMHALIDITDLMFMGTNGVSIMLVILFVLLLTAEIIYTVFLMKRYTKKTEDNLLPKQTRKEVSSEKTRKRTKNHKR